MPFLSCFFILLISSAYIFKNKNRDNYKSEGCFEASKITNKIPAKYVVKSVCFPRRRKKCIFFESYSDFPCTVLRKKGECVTFHLSIIRWKMHHYYTAEEGVCRIASRAILPGAMERMPRESSSSSDAAFLCDERRASDDSGQKGSAHMRLWKERVMGGSARRGSVRKRLDCADGFCGLLCKKTISNSDGGIRPAFFPNA